MTTTGVRAIERSIHKTNEWLAELDDLYGWEDRDKTYQSCRAVLHALRDRLSVEEATDLGAQLPLIVRGMYFDGWQTNRVPVRIRTLEQFFERVATNFGGNAVPDPQKLTKGVFQILERHVSQGEIADIQASLPDDILTFWRSKAGS